MAKLNLAKTVRDGMVVAKWGSKFVRAGKHRKPCGVFQSASIQRVLTDEGIQTVVLPRGVVFYGRANVQVTI